MRAIRALRFALPFALILAPAAALTGCEKEDVVSALATAYYGYNGEFHSFGCSVLQGVPNSSLSKFSTREDAVRAALRACVVCQP